MNKKKQKANKKHRKNVARLKSKRKASIANKKK